MQAQQGTCKIKAALDPERLHIHLWQARQMESLAGVVGEVLLIP